VDGGFSGDISLSPVSTRLDEVLMPRKKVGTAEGASMVDGNVLLLQEMESSLDVMESFLFLNFTLRYQWGVENVTTVLPGSITAELLEGFDILLVPHIRTQLVLAALSRTGGVEAIQNWVVAGGRFVGFQGGAELASAMSISTNVFVDSEGVSPGTLIRIIVEDSHPVAVGVGEEAFQYYDDTMKKMYLDPTDDKTFVIAYFPDSSNTDWFVSGYSDEIEDVGNSIAAAQSLQGAGCVTTFAMEMNFRSFTTGTSKMVYNSLTSAACSTASFLPSASLKHATSYQKQTQLSTQYNWRLTARVVVSRQKDSTEIVARALQSLGQDPRALQLIPEKQTARYLVFAAENAQSLDLDEHPWLLRFSRAVEAEGLKLHGIMMSH
jgi:hypothetical protein